MNYSNNAYSVLNGALTNVATAITVATGTGSRFPSSDFRVTMIGYDVSGNENAWEICHCTTRTGDVLTVTRGQEGTTAVAWANGARIENRITAGTMNLLAPLASPSFTGTAKFGSDLANYLQGVGAASGSMPVLSAQGSDTNINLGLAGKGSGGVTLWSQGVIGFSVSNPASAVNYLAAVGSVAGAGVNLAAAGSDTNINVAISAKGSGSVQAWSNGAAVFLASAPVSAVNYLGFSASTTGNSVGVSAYGSDANVDLALAAKGSGVVKTSSVFAATKSVQEARVALGANNIDLSSGNFFTKTISGATTFTVSNVPATGTAASFILDLTNGGSATITWWSGMKWAGGTAPTLTASGRDVLGFYTHDSGTTWTGLVLAKDVK